MEGAREVKVEVERPRCPYCHESIATEARKSACEACLAWHHLECWEEHGGCSGCGRGREAVRRVAPGPARPIESRAQQVVTGVLSWPRPWAEAGSSCRSAGCREGVLAIGRCERHLRIAARLNTALGAIGLVALVLTTPGWPHTLFLSLPFGLFAVIGFVGAGEKRRWLRRPREGR